MFWTGHTNSAGRQFWYSPVFNRLSLDVPAQGAGGFLAEEMVCGGGRGGGREVSLRIWYTGGGRVVGNEACGRKGGLGGSRV